MYSIYDYCIVTFCIKVNVYYCLTTDGNINKKFILLYISVVLYSVSILPLLSYRGRHVIEALTGSCRRIR